METNELDNNIIQSAKDDAFYLLSFRERSQYELTMRLVKKGYSKDIINFVIEHLKELDYLNDERFVEKWVKDRIKFNPRGSLLIKMELKEKGISDKVIERVLNRFVDDKLEQEMAEKLARKWLKGKKDFSHYKLKRYLKSRGFSIDIINRVYNSY
jgi:regulatory protein